MGSLLGYIDHRQAQGPSKFLSKYDCQQNPFLAFQDSHMTLNQRLGHVELLTSPRMKAVKH